MHNDDGDDVMMMIGYNVKYNIILDGYDGYYHDVIKYGKKNYRDVSGMVDLRVCLFITRSC